MGGHHSATVTQAGTPSQAVTELELTTSTSSTIGSLRLLLVLLLLLVVDQDY